MATETKIEWCDSTFNPWVGCQKVSTGCANCYAERDFDKRRGFAKWGPAGSRILTSADNWRKPVRWNRDAQQTGVRRKVFCASLADVFEDWDEEMQAWVGGGPVKLATRTGLETMAQWPRETGWRPLTMIDVRQRLFDLIDRTPNLDWLLLTKRPENVSRLMPAYMPHYLAEAGTMNQEEIRENVWIGTSVENQDAADKRIPELIKIPAAVRFLSCEPLLGWLDLNHVELNGGEFSFDALNGHWNTYERGECGKVHWVIAGGESGPNARPMHPAAARSLRDQCDEAGTPFFFKQWGEWAEVPAGTPLLDKPGWTFAGFADGTTMQRLGKRKAGKLLDGREWHEFPQPHPGEEL